MTIVAPIQAAPAQPRALGDVRVSARLRGDQSVLGSLRCAGSAKALFPLAPGKTLQTVLLNTAGGVTGGDCFQTDASAGPGASLSLTTQTTERAYRAQPGQTGRIDVNLKLEDGAELAWLPQETIVFDGARLTRRISVQMAPDATLVAAEAIVLGRRAMGERVTDARLQDIWRIRRGDELVYADALRLDGDAEALAKRPAILAGATAFASLVIASPAAETLLGGLRQRLGDAGGASLVRPGIVAARMIAPDGYHLRKTLAPVLEYATARPLPTVWTM